MNRNLMISVSQSEGTKANEEGTSISTTYMLQLKILDFRLKCFKLLQADSQFPFSPRAKETEEIENQPTNQN